MMKITTCYSKAEKLEKLVGRLKYFSELSEIEKLVFEVDLFASIAGSSNFYNAEKVLKEKDQFIDFFLAEKPLNLISHYAPGVVFYNSILFFTRVIESIAPLKKETQLLSRVRFNDKGVAENISNVYNVVFQSFREFFIVNHMLEESAFYRTIHNSYKISMASVIESNFMRDIQGKDMRYDVVLSTEMFVRLTSVFREEMSIVHYSTLVRSNFQKDHASILGLLETTKFDFSTINSTISAIREIRKLALKVTHMLDAKIKSELKGYSQSKGTGVNIPGRSFINNNNFIFGATSSDVIENTYTREVLSSGFQYQVNILKPARNLAKQFNSIQHRSKKYIEMISKELERFQEKALRQNLMHNGVSGSLNASRSWRKDIDDPTFFSFNEDGESLDTTINCFMLIDNSCSIPSKVKVLSEIIVLLASTMAHYSHIFTTLNAYAQKGTDNRVYLTPLVNGETKKNISQLGSLVYFNNNLVNYDPYALYEILSLHKDLLKQKDKVNVCFIIGDAFPVSIGESGDAKKEAKSMIENIKLEYNYSRLIIIYIASAAQYNPLDLGYDYYIQLPNDSWNISSFTEQFKQVISKILNDVYY